MDNCFRVLQNVTSPRLDSCKNQSFLLSCKAALSVPLVKDELFSWHPCCVLVQLAVPKVTLQMATDEAQTYISWSLLVQVRCFGAGFACFLPGLLVGEWVGDLVQQYILIWWGIAIPASLMRPGVERHRTGSGTPIQYSQFVMGQDNSFHQRLMHSDKCAAMQPWNWSSLCEGDFQTTHVLLLACLEGVRVHMAWAVRQWPQLGPSGPQQISIQSLWPTR